MINLFDFNNIPWTSVQKIGTGFTTPTESTPNIQQSIMPTAQTQNTAPALHLFSDEVQARQKMISSGLSESQADYLIKKRRQDLLGNTKLTPQEATGLLKMQADNLDTKTAVDLLQKKREADYQKKGIGEKAFIGATGLATGALTTAGKTTLNFLDFIAKPLTGYTGFWDEAKQYEQAQKVSEWTVWQGTASKVGSFIEWAGMMAAAPAPSIGWAGLGGAVLRWTTYGWVYWALDPIAQKGSEATMWDIAKWWATWAITGAVAWPLLEKVAVPIIQKGVKYWTAWVQAGLNQWASEIIPSVTKSIGRDVSKLWTEASKVAETISTKANRFNAKDEEKFIQATGQTPGQFAVQRGMNKTGDKAVEESTNLFKKSMKEADDAFATIEGKFTTKWQQDDILGDLIDSNIQKIKAQPRNPDKARVLVLQKKYEEGGLTASEINEAKRIHARNNKFTWDQRASDAAVNASNLQNDIRSWQQKFAEENGFDNIAQINKNTQAWKMYADSLAKKLARSGANNAVSLTDWIALSGGQPENIALFLWKKALTSDFAKWIGIKTLGKQTKPSIIKANKEAILESNKIKGGNRILSNMSNTGNKPVVKLLWPATGKPTSANVSNVKPIIATDAGKLSKTSKAISGKVWEKPGTSYKEWPIIQWPQTNKPKMLMPPKNEFKISKEWDSHIKVELKDGKWFISATKNIWEISNKYGKKYDWYIAIKKIQLDKDIQGKWIWTEMYKQLLASLPKWTKGIVGITEGMQDYKRVSSIYKSLWGKQDELWNWILNK